MKFILTIFCLLCQFAAKQAYADSDDTINFIVGADYRHYDNLFQLADGVNPAGKGAERSDNILRTSLGVDFDKKYGMQDFKFNFTHVDSRYDNAEFLNFKSNNYKAAWLWAITPNLGGDISADRKVDLIPFTDNQNSDTKNTRTIESQRINFDWSPHNVWHLLGGYNKLKSVNSQSFAPETSFNLDGLELGVKYSWPSESYVAFKVRKRDGENQDINSLKQVGKNFTEDDDELSILWNLSESSKLTSSLGYTTHKDDTYTLRDYSGYYYGANYTWSPRDKLNVSVDYTRKLSSFIQDTSSYNSNDVLGVKASWVYTSKVTVSAYALASKRKFLGDGPSSPSITPARVDDGQTYGLEVSWRPRNGINIAATLQHNERDSNVASSDFSSNVIGINGRFTF